MFIINSESITNKIGFEEKVSNYLENHGVPLLTAGGGIYYYAKTKLLDDVLKDKKTPLWVKLAKRFN
jgi:calcineurin-like phosphoesterase